MYKHSLTWLPMSLFITLLKNNGHAPIEGNEESQRHYDLLIEAYMACIYADCAYSYGHDDLRSAFESAFGRLRLLGVMASGDESNLIFKDYDEQVFMLSRLINKASSPKEKQS